MLRPTPKAMPEKGRPPLGDFCYPVRRYERHEQI
jgi:hypothetical protein